MINNEDKDTILFGRLNYWMKKYNVDMKHNPDRVQNPVGV